MKRLCTTLLVASLALVVNVASAMAQAGEAPVPPTPFASPSPLPSAQGLPSAMPSVAPGPSAVPAGVVPSSLHLTVTGDPADPTFLEATLRDAVERAVRPTLQPGAVVTLGPFTPAPQALQVGFETAFTIPVTIRAGAGTVPVEGSVDADVLNVDSRPFMPPLLSFDDDPERITGDGVLFRGSVDAARPMRLYYYHQNTGPGRRVLVLLSSNTTTRVALIDAVAGPSVDVMSVGHSVSRTFLLVKPRNEGTIVDVTAPALAQHDLIAQAGDVIAGALDVRVLMGGPVTLTVMAIPSDADPAAYLQAPKLPGDGHNRHGTFDLVGYGESLLTYTAGGPDASLSYGGRDRSPQNVDPNDAGSDVGDYGVLHRMTFDLTNPLGVPAGLYLYERPLGGVVRSSFLVDGTLQTVDCVRLPNRYQISSYQLAAQSKATIEVLTMTDGGSSYPIEVGITATPPLPTAPPMFAPDGCFPKPVPPSPAATPPGLQSPEPSPSGPAPSPAPT